MSQNHYQVLGVLPTASAEVIKQAYRRLAIQLHPDKHGGDPRHEEQFKAVATAYSILSNPGRRAQYDFQLQQATQRAQAPRPAAEAANGGPSVYKMPTPAPAPAPAHPPARRCPRAPLPAAHAAPARALQPAGLLAGGHHRRLDFPVWYLGQNRDGPCGSYYQLR